MKSITLGLALSLLGGVALAQTPSPSPSAPPPKPPAAAPTPPQPSPPSAPASQGQQDAQAGQPAPGGPPEGTIVETPNGFYLVRPGDPNPQRLNLVRGGSQGGAGQPSMGQPQGAGQQGMGQRGMGQPMMGQDASADPGDGDDMQGDMAGNGMPRPHRRGPPPRPPEGKGARLRIHSPNLDISVKCPDEEPIKACVDSVSQLMDKANATAH